MENTSKPELHEQFWQHRSFLLHLANRQLNDPTLAEDVVQETLLGAWQSQEKFEGKSALRTWLVSILRFKLIDCLRQRKHQTISVQSMQCEIDAQDLSVLFDSDGQWRDMPTSWQSLESDPEQCTEHQQFLDLLEQCLKKLPAQTSRIFLLREYLGFQAEEISKQTGLPGGHIRILIMRARLSLRTCMTHQLTHHQPKGSSWQQIPI